MQLFARIIVRTEAVAEAVSESEAVIESVGIVLVM